VVSIATAEREKSFECFRVKRTLLSQHVYVDYWYIRSSSSGVYLGVVCDVSSSTTSCRWNMKVRCIDTGCGKDDRAILVVLIATAEREKSFECFRFKRTLLSPACQRRLLVHVIFIFQRHLGVVCDVSSTTSCFRLRLPCEISHLN